VTLTLTTALPWLASMLLTDIFAGLSVLSLFVLVLHGDKVSKAEKGALFAFTAFAAATHSATLAVLMGLCCVGWIARPLLRERIAPKSLALGTLTIVAGALLLLAANFALSGRLAWTPGGYSIAFARMLQDGIVTRYLREHFRIRTASSSVICQSRSKRCARRGNRADTLHSGRSTWSTSPSRWSRSSWSSACSRPQSGSDGATSSSCSPRP
jgi:hypothetical protein